MKGLFKKLVVGATSLAMVASMSTAFAQTEMSNMVFAGYDTTDPLNPNRVYNEVIDGKFTNKQVLEPVAPEEITWEFEGFEDAYPHAGYSRMYINGEPQEVTVYNQLVPQWETRRQDYSWQTAYPYTIYERHQTKINNQTWTWDYGNALFNIPDEALLSETKRRATVLDIDMKDYGFGPFTKEGKLLSDNQIAMYKRFNVDDAITEWNPLTTGALSVASLSARDENNLYIMTDEMITEAIPAVYSKFLTAQFSSDLSDPTGRETKDFAALYLANGIAEDKSTTWGEWDEDTLVLLHRGTERCLGCEDDNCKCLEMIGACDCDTCAICNNGVVDYRPIAKGEVATVSGYFKYPVINNFNYTEDRITYDPAVVQIDWTEPIYESKEPYKYFQYLIINGIVMDGDIDDNGHRDNYSLNEAIYNLDLDGDGKIEDKNVDMPTELYRYTGGVGSPVVEWKYLDMAKTGEEIVIGLDESKWAPITEKVVVKDDLGNVLDDIYQVVEIKYLNGEPVLEEYDLDNDDELEKYYIIRYPNGKYGTTYFEVDGSTIQYYVTDGEGHEKLIGSVNKAGRAAGSVEDGIYDPENIADASTNGLNYAESLW